MVYLYLLKSISPARITPPPIYVSIDGISFITIEPITAEIRGVTNIKFVTSLVIFARESAFPHQIYATALGKLQDKSVQAMLSAQHLQAEEYFQEEKS